MQKLEIGTRVKYVGDWIEEMQGCEGVIAATVPEYRRRVVFDNDVEFPTGRWCNVTSLKEVCPTPHEIACRVLDIKPDEPLALRLKAGQGSATHKAMYNIAVKALEIARSYE